MKKNLATHLNIQSHLRDKILVCQITETDENLLVFHKKNLKSSTWNYLATHFEKLATQKCVATPRLRTTGLDKR